MMSSGLPSQRGPETTGYGESLREDHRPYATDLGQMASHFATGAASFEGYVPASIVHKEHPLPFKQERTNELVDDLLKTRIRDGWGNGQDSPLLVASIINEPLSSLEVYEGLHRQIANAIMQQRHGIERGRPAEVVDIILDEAVHFVSVKEMTRRDMLDKRLANTSNHPELRFARGGLWTSQLWYLDDISKLAQGISPKQAFNLAEREQAGRIKDVERIGKGLGLEPETAELIIVWANERADGWSVDASTVYKWIHRAERLDPELVARIRNPGKGGSSKGVLTETKARTLGDHMAGEEFIDVRKVLATYVERHDLSDDQFAHLVQIIGEASLNDLTDVSEVLKFIESINPDSLRKRNPDRDKRRIRPRTDVFAAGEGAVTSVEDAIDRISESLDVRDERGEEFQPSADQKEAAIKAAEALEAQAARARNLARRTRARASGRDAAFDTTPASEFDPTKFHGTLTDQELTILQYMADGLPNRKIGERMNLTEKTVKNYSSNLMNKLGVSNRTSAAVRGAMLGFVEIKGLGQLSELVPITDLNAMPSDNDALEHVHDTLGGIADLLTQFTVRVDTASDDSILGGLEEEEVQATKKAIQRLNRLLSAFDTLLERAEEPTREE